jgi:hypothetical protein
VSIVIPFLSVPAEQVAVAVAVADAASTLDARQQPGRTP